MGQSWYSNVPVIGVAQSISVKLSFLGVLCDKMKKCDKKYAIKMLNLVVRLREIGCGSDVSHRKHAAYILGLVRKEVLSIF